MEPWERHWKERSELKQYNFKVAVSGNYFTVIKEESFGAFSYRHSQLHELFADFVDSPLDDWQQQQLRKVTRIPRLFGRNFVSLQSRTKDIPEILYVDRIQNKGLYTELIYARLPQPHLANALMRKGDFLNHKLINTTAPVDTLLLREENYADLKESYDCFSHITDKKSLSQLETLLATFGIVAKSDGRIRSESTGSVTYACKFTVPRIIKNQVEAVTKSYGLPIWTNNMWWEPPCVN